MAIVKKIFNPKMNKSIKYLIDSKEKRERDNN